MERVQVPVESPRFQVGVIALPQASPLTDPVVPIAPGMSPRAGRTAGRRVGRVAA